MEMCSGKSAKCPSSKKTCPKSHGSPASSNTTSTCGSGLCTDRDLQCQSQSDSGYTYATACSTSASSCQMSCSDPTDTMSQPSRCLSLLVNFADGTQCGEGGTCTNGACVGGELRGFFLSFYSLGSNYGELFFFFWRILRKGILLFLVPNVSSSRPRAHRVMHLSIFFLWSLSR